MFRARYTGTSWLATSDAAMVQTRSSDSAAAVAMPVPKASPAQVLPPVVTLKDIDEATASAADTLETTLIAARLRLGLDEPPPDAHNVKSIPIPRYGFEMLFKNEAVWLAAEPKLAAHLTKAVTHPWEHTITTSTDATTGQVKVTVRANGIVDVVHLTGKKGAADDDTAADDGIRVLCWVTVVVAFLAASWYTGATYGLW